MFFQRFTELLYEFVNDSSTREWIKLTLYKVRRRHNKYKFNLGSKFEQLGKPIFALNHTRGNGKLHNLFMVTLPIYMNLGKYKYFLVYIQITCTLL